ncbi:MAG: hypothetical protein HYR89_06175 [Actinobacteria bacterium]|nr:hypothetical protein [Actinomycetota bacterium]
MDAMRRVPDNRDDLSTFEAVMGRMSWYHRVEVELFHTLGRWATQPDGADLDPADRVLLGTQARYHAWHGELWREQFPTAGQAFAELPTTLFAESALSPKVGLPSLGFPNAPNEGIEVLYDEVLPHLAGLYESHLEATSPMTDGPIVRVLHLVLATRSTWARRPAGRSEAASWRTSPLPDAPGENAR